MSDINTKINEIIQAAALDGTLTRSAIAQFEELITENTTLVDHNQELEAALDVRKTDLIALEKRVARQNDDLSIYEKRLATIDEREQKMTTLELTAKHESKRVEDHKAMVELIFRNSILRREVMTPLAPSSISDNGMTSPQGYAQKDTVETKEE